MGKARVKVTLKPKRDGRSGTLLASVPVKVSQGEPGRTKLYETKAQLTAHIYYGSRPSKTRIRGAR